MPSLAFYIKTGNHIVHSLNIYSVVFATHAQSFNFCWNFPASQNSHSHLKNKLDSKVLASFVSFLHRWEPPVRKCPHKMELSVGYLLNQWLKCSPLCGATPRQVVLGTVRKQAKYVPLCLCLQFLSRLSSLIRTCKLK